MKKLYILLLFFFVSIVVFSQNSNKAEKDKSDAISKMQIKVDQNSDTRSNPVHIEAQDAARTADIQKKVDEFKYLFRTLNRVSGKIDATQRKSLPELIVNFDRLAPNYPVGAFDEPSGMERIYIWIDRYPEEFMQIRQIMIRKTEQMLPQ